MMITIDNFSLMRKYVFYLTSRIFDDTFLGGTDDEISVNEIMEHQFVLITFCDSMLQFSKRKCFDYLGTLR